LATVLLTWKLGSRMFDPRAAWLGAALLAVCPMVVWDAHQARADQLLMAATTAAMACLYGAVRTGSVGSALAFWALVGIGVLAKGFITPLVAGGAIAMLLLVSDDRRRLLARVRPIEGVLVLAAVVVPWVALVAARFGWGEYMALIWDETFRRAAAGSREGHFAPPGTHLLLLGALFWPGCLGAVFGFMRAVRLGLPARNPGAGRWTFRRRAGRRGELFLLAWIVPAWIIFELSLAKLPHYTLPLYPAVALLCARAVLGAAFSRESGRLHRLGVVVWWGAPLVLGLGLCAIGLACVWQDALGVGPYVEAISPLGAGLLLAGGGAAVVLTLACAPTTTGRWAPRAQIASIVAAAAITAPLLQWIAPAVVPGARTAAAMRIVETVPGLARRPVASTYHEDSMVFSTRGRVVRLAPERMAEYLAAHPDAVIIREGRHSDDDGRVEGLPLIGTTRGDPWIGRRPLGVSAAP
ncbi:MAG: glycosyltransferase family 39 protein, partial [Phycisphaerae bacterium]|nr:glycosyltransferase family 39 protein [Phycisphaerae bacterium]